MKNETSRLATKPIQWHVRPAKTQISLGIRPVWSESSLCAQWVAKDPSFLHVDSKDSDQTGRMPRLIWVFAGRTCHFVGFVTRRLKLLMARLNEIHFYKTGFFQMYQFSLNFFIVIQGQEEANQVFVLTTDYFSFEMLSVCRNECHSFITHIHSHGKPAANTDFNCKHPVMMI